MSLSFHDLQQALDTTSGTLKVDAETLKSGSITSLLEDFFDRTLLVQPVQPAAKGTITAGQRSLDTVVVVGTLASQFCKLTNLKLNAQFYLLDDVAQVRITLTLPDPWKLSSSFPSLLGSEIDDAELHDCVFQVDSLRPNRLGAAFDALFEVRDGVARGLACKNGLTLTAQLRLDSVETTLTDFIGVPGLLSLQGPVEVTVGPDNEHVPG